MNILQVRVMDKDLANLKVVALAGGVGGAKLAYGLAKNLTSGNLTVIVNTGDDFEHFGLYISPDVDTVCYTLAGLANPETGWGLRNESWRVFEALEDLNAPGWFRLGDRDLATHLERTRLLDEGQRLSEITRRFCAEWNVDQTVLPMSDKPVRTIVQTQDGQDLSFQEYFVHQKCQPCVKGFYFSGVDKAKPAPGIIVKIKEADIIIICPSNPWVSIDPILAIKGIKAAVSKKPVIAVSPIVGGKAIKGPAAKMYSELGITPSATAVAEHYKEFLSGFVFDEIDKNEFENFTQWRIIPYVTDTIMRSLSERIRLANEILEFGNTIIRRNTLQ